LAEQLRKTPGVQQAVAFGNSLHVSSNDAAALERAIAPFRHEPYDWRQIASGLEDAFHQFDGTRKIRSMKLPHRFSFQRLRGIIAKEFTQMRRDRLTFAMMLGIPLIQLTLFGFAINSDPRHLPAAVLLADQARKDEPSFTR
jgi:hypothetical protein